MFHKLFLVALVAVTSNARTIDHPLVQSGVEAVNIGTVEIKGTVDKNDLKATVGEFSVQAYPFIVGLVRDKNEVSAKVLLDQAFTVKEQAMSVRWDSRVGQKSAETKLDYSSGTLIGNPKVTLQGLWNYQDDTKRSAQASVSLTDEKGNGALTLSVGLDNEKKTTLDTTLTVGPVTLTLVKSKANTLDEKIDVNLPSVNMGGYSLQFAAGGHQDADMKRDFYLSTDSGVFQGTVKVNSEIQVDVSGGITLYNINNDGFVLQVTHDHSDKNSFVVKTNLGPLTATVSVDKSDNRVASATLDFDFVKFTVNMAADGSATYEATGVLDPVTIVGKADQHGITSLLLQLYGGSQYSLELSSNLNNVFTADLTVQGQAFTFQL